MKSIVKIIFSLLVVSVVIGSVVLGSRAFFSDTEESKGNVFAAGAIDLKVDNSSYYNYLECTGGVWTNTGDRPLDQTLEELIGKECKTSWEYTDLDENTLFFDFNDVKPGDWGEDTISLRVIDNDAWMCMDLEVTGTPENGQTEPEALVDETTGDQEGELQDYLKFVFWADDGDNVLEEDEKPFVQDVPLSAVYEVALADSKNNVWGEVGSPFPGGEENAKYIAKAWCFGDLTLEPVAQGDNSPTQNPGILCDGQALDNSTQTDGLTANVYFSAVQARNNPDFVCFGCEIFGQGNAVSVESSSQGKRNDGSDVLVTRQDPAQTLGPADGTDGGGNPIEGKFFSLGFGGEIVLKLASYVTGDTITIREITGGRDTYPEEKAELYVSEDNVNWVMAGTASSKGANGYSTVNVSGTGLDKILYIKVVDVTDPEIHNETADGYDIDAIEADLCLDDISD